MTKNDLTKKFGFSTTLIRSLYEFNIKLKKNKNNNKRETRKIWWNQGEIERQRESERVTKKDGMNE